MKVYLRKDRQCMTQHLTANHVTVTEGRQKHVNTNYTWAISFLPLNHLMTSQQKQIYSCGNARPNRRGMSQDLAPKKIKLKQGDTHVRTREDVMALLWWDKRDICMLMNIHDASAESNFCNGGRKAISLKLWWIITVTWAMWIRETEWQTVTPTTGTRSSGQKTVFPSVRLGHSQQLHSSFLAWGYENFT